MAETEKDPIEQAVELLLYAPVGLLYEYQSVLPQLVKRGKSQVQLARLIGKMALDRQSPGMDDSIERAVGGVLGATAQVLTDIGEAIGLAPPSDTGHASAAESSPPVGALTPHKPELESPEPPKPIADDPSGPAKRLPIARYDELTAKEIIPLLDDLKPAQRARINQYEQANRARKTVLAKIKRLEA